MKNLGSVTDPQDVATKQYVDSVAGSGSGDITVNDLFALLQAGSNISLEIVDGKVKVTATDTDTVTRVKGNAESTYRSGDVNLTPANIGAAESGHTHDDRYYTESEINTKLSGKSDTSHTHDDRYYTESEVDAKLSRTAVTISGLPSRSSYTCYYYPAFKICFLRLYLTGSAYSAATTVTVGTVASGYRPPSTHALAISVAQDAAKKHQSSINSSGQIRFFTEVAKESANDMYITGFWFV